MKPAVALLPIALLALNCIAPQTAAAAASDEVSARIIIKWRTSAQESPSRLQRLLTDSTRRVERAWDIGGDFSVARVQASDERAAADALAALRDHPEVEFAVHDAHVRPQAYIPNDPQFATEQWYLQSAHPAAIRAQDAWDISRGGNNPTDSSVIVAVLDTGVRLDHPDLAGKLLPGYDFVSDPQVGNDGNGWDADPSDPGDYMSAEDLQSSYFRNNKCGGGDNRDQPTQSSWHGTRVAGLIAAASDNGVGMTGAGFHVRVMPVRVLGKCGGYVSDVIAGMYWAAGLAPPPPLLQDPLPPVNRTPARIINLSLGSDHACTDDVSEVYRVAVRQVTAAGSLVVASAGNYGGAVGTPGGCDGVLGVGGIRHAGTKVGYSNLGPEVDISAPAGNCVLSGFGDPCVFALNTLTNLGTQGPTANGYSSPLVQPTYGTSFSTPLVAGTAALMISANPSLKPQRVIELIRATARPFPAVSDTMPQPPACVSTTITPVQGSECICTTALCGAGMLDAGAAVRAARDDPPPAVPPSGGNAQGGGGGSLTVLPVLALGLLLAQRRRRHAPLLHIH